MKTKIEEVINKFMKAAKTNKHAGLILELGIMAIVIVFATPAFSLETNLTNTLTIEPVTTQPGTVITVPIMVEHATGIGGIGVKLSYDPEVVNVVEAVHGEFSAFWGFDKTNAENGWVTINTYVLGRDLTGDVKVADITLEAVGNAGDSSILDLEILSLSDQYGTDVTGTMDDGIFIIPPEEGDGGTNGRIPTPMPTPTSSSTLPATSIPVATPSPTLTPTSTPTPTPTQTIKPTAAPTPPTPGFGALLAIAGILMAGYLAGQGWKRKKKV